VALGKALTLRNHFPVVGYLLSQNRPEAAYADLFENAEAVCKVNRVPNCRSHPRSR
jgi:hypothetical protein